MTPNQPAGSEPNLTPHLETSRLHVRRILAATDFAPIGQAAVRAGITYARFFDAELLVLTVLPAAIYAGMAGEGDDGMTAAALAQAAQTAAKARLDRMQQEFPELAGVRHRQLLIHGSAAAAIEEVARQENVDLVVVGTRAAGGLEKLLLGSTAEAVLRRSRSAVLVIGPQCGPVRAECDSIVLATDLGPNALRPAQYAAAFAEEVAARLTVVHVAGDKPPRPGTVAEGAVEKEMRGLLPADIDLWAKSQLRVVYGEAGACILEAARAESADLLVLGARVARLGASHAPWAVLTRVLHAAPCPVLAVRPHLE